MLRQVAGYWTELMISKEIIERERERIYIYGLELFLSTISSILSMLLLSIVTNNFLNGILFLLVTIPLKMTANGYHAKTFSKCFLLTNSIFLIYICLVSLYPNEIFGMVEIALFAVSAIYIYAKAPIEHPDHNLTEQKRKKNRLYARVILLIDCLAVFVFRVIGQQKTVHSLCTAVMLAACIMMIKNKEE